MPEEAAQSGTAGPHLDIVIIGAGLTGLATAYLLHQAGRHVQIVGEPGQCLAGLVDAGDSFHQGLALLLIQVRRDTEGPRPNAAFGHRPQRRAHRLEGIGLTGRIVEKPDHGLDAVVDEASMKLSYDAYRRR